MSTYKDGAKVNLSVRGPFNHSPQKFIILFEPMATPEQTKE